MSGNGGIFHRRGKPCTLTDICGDVSGSLSRLDYYLNNENDFSFDSKTYQVMSDVAMANGDDFGLDTTNEAHHRHWLNSSE